MTQWRIKIETQTKKPFLIISVYLAIAIILYGGFGKKYFYDLGFCYLLGSILPYCVLEKKWGASITVIAIFLSGIYAPWLWKLDGVQSLILIPFPVFYPALGAILIRWCTDYLPVGRWAIIPILPLLAAALLNLFSVKYQKHILVLLIILLSGFTIADLLKMQSVYQIDPGNPTSYEYGLSGVIESYFPKKFIPKTDSTTPFIIRSMIHGTHVDSNHKGIILVDHDQWSHLPAWIKMGNWQQPLPWSENEFIGDQYWRAAISHDEMLVSNIGGELFPKSTVKLAYPSIFPSRVKTLAIQAGNVLLLSDSDYFVNRLLPYQQSLIGAILKTGRPTFLLRCASFLLLLACVFILFNKSVSPIAIMGVLIATTAFLGNSHESIRYVGSQYDPHDTARSWAVKRALVDQGIKLNSVETEDTAVLVLAAGKSTNSDNEKLIVAEPESRIFLHNHIISVNEVPLGMQDGIPDARNISVDGVIKGVRIDVDGIQIIGTGSPAQLPKEIWYQFLPH